MTGMFLSEMKNAVIKPTLKKVNADVDNLSNYRPVFNLSAFSEILERIVLHLLNFHSFYSEVQSGYRLNHSCEILLVRICDGLNKEIEAGNVAIVVLLDLSAAFDTIDHTVLLEKCIKDKISFHFIFLVASLCISDNSWCSVMFLNIL